MSNIELEKIVDILPPTAPQGTTENIWPLLIGMTLFIAVALIKYHRTEQQQLKRLKKQYKKNNISQRQLAFKIAKLLKKCKQYKSTPPSDMFNKQLQAACFSRNGVDERLMASLIDQVKKWI